MLFKVDVFSFCLDNVPTDKPTDYETILTKPNKYSIFVNGDIIPKNRKCEYIDEAQTRVVWAFSNLLRTLSTTICKKSINTLRQILDRIFNKTFCATLTNFGECIVSQK